MPASHVTVAVTGAAGQIGYALVFRIASGQMFGPETTVDLQLLELEVALPSLEGVAMELDDCAFPLLRQVVRTASLDQAFDGINWALLVGAVPRKALLGHRSGTEVAGVGDLAIWGNHSSTQFPDFYHATIGGRPAPEVIGDEAWLQGEFITTVQQRGAAVIAARGQSSAASAAN